jgi:hypothetical protein
MIWQESYIAGSFQPVENLPCLSMIWLESYNSGQITER